MPPVYLNGALVPEAEAAVSVFDHGLVVGDGVFETVLVLGRRPFALGRHLDRLATSAAGLGIAVPTRAELLEAARLVAGGGPPGRARMRITVTSGPGPLGSGRGSKPATLVVAITAEDPPEPAASVVVAPWTRNERGALCGLKTTSYAENARALAHAAAAGASEAVFANSAGLLCEGTGSNVFVVVAGTLCTPSLTSGCLAGITRGLLLERFGGEERDLPIGRLSPGGVDEAFLTSTLRGVQSIVAVDGAPLPGPGPITTAAADAYRSLLEAEPAVASRDA